MKVKSDSLVCFIIALKRWRKNSVIIKSPKYLLCKQFNLSVNTFSKYLSEAIRLGYILDEGATYRIIKFKKIIKSEFEGSERCFTNHRIIKKSKSTDFKKIKYEFEQLLTVDNVIRRQERRIAQKKKFTFKTGNFRIQSNILGTELTRQGGLSYKGKVIPQRVRRKVVLEHSDSMFNDKVVTSARNLAKKIGVSVSKANQILNRTDFYIRKHIVLWINGCNSTNYELTMAKYPDAVVIPCYKKDRIKVCFGCEVTCLV